MFFVTIKLFDNNGEEALYKGMHLTDEEAEMTTTPRLVQEAIKELNEMEDDAIRLGWRQENERTLETPFYTIKWEKIRY